MKRMTEASLLLGLAAALGFVGTGDRLIFGLGNAAVVVAGVWCALRWYPDLAGGSRRLFAFLLAWGLFSLATVVWSAWKDLSLWLGLVIASTPFATLICSRLLQERDRWRTVRACTLGIILFAAAWTILEAGIVGGRSDGPFHDFNAPDAFFNLALFPILFHFVGRTDRSIARATGLLTALFVLALAVAATYSRGGSWTLAVGLIASTGLLLWLYGRHGRA
ncbi:MAG TPA: hypothetical protein VKA13_05685, partial [Gammaproteobacteria bacterium]|nr:hypothetical protein [Gammaproteobacteria bacterium]